MRLLVGENMVLVLVLHQDRLQVLMPSGLSSSDDCFMLQSHPVRAGPSGEANHRPVSQEVGQPEEEVQGESADPPGRDPQLQNV